MITREGEGGVHGGAEERGIHNAPHPGSHRRVYRTLMQPDAVGSFSDGDEKERLDPGQRLFHRLDVAVISDRNHFGTGQVNGYNGCWVINRWDMPWRARRSATRRPTFPRGVGIANESA